MIDVIFGSVCVCILAEKHFIDFGIMNNETSSETVVINNHNGTIITHFCDITTIMNLHVCLKFQLRFYFSIFLCSNR